MCCALAWGRAYQMPTHEKTPPAAEPGACGFLPPWLLRFPVPGHTIGQAAKSNGKRIGPTVQRAGPWTRHSSAQTEPYCPEEGASPLSFGLLVCGIVSSLSSLQGSREHQQKGEVGLCMSTRKCYANGKCQGCCREMTHLPPWAHRPCLLPWEPSLAPRSTVAFSWYSSELPISWA